MNHNRSTALERSVKNKYVTNIIAELKYKYGQQEEVTVRNRNRSIALERSV